MRGLINYVFEYGGYMYIFRLERNKTKFIIMDYGAGFMVYAPTKMFPSP